MGAALLLRRRALLGTPAGAPAPGPVAPDRGLQFGIPAGATGGASALLDVPDGLFTASTFEIDVDVRFDASSTGSYALGLASGTTDNASLVYGYIANLFEFYANGTNLGPVRLALGTATPPGNTVYNVKFRHDGTTLAALLNGAPSSSLSAPGLQLHLDALVLALGVRNDTGGAPSPVTFARVAITVGGVLRVNLLLDETTGTYANTGTIGGQLRLSSPPPISVLFNP